jgi:hypothetical protein
MENKRSIRRTLVIAAVAVLGGIVASCGTIKPLSPCEGDGMGWMGGEGSGPYIRPSNCKTQQTPAPK